MHFRRRLLILALMVNLAGPAASATPTLRLAGTAPSPMAEAVQRRALARAAAMGLNDAEVFGTPSLIVRGATVIAALVSGRATDARLDGHEKTCFLAIVLPGAAVPDLLLTVGRWPWADENCHGYNLLGQLPGLPDAVRIGVIYDGAAPNATHTEPVVVLWREGRPLEVDFSATQRCASAGAATLAEMRRLTAPPPGSP